MRLDFTIPDWSFNPFKSAEHNSVTLPRIAFHGLHVLIGIPALLLYFLGVSFWISFAIIAVLAIYDKFIWIDTKNKKVHWWVVDEYILVWDFIGDFLLTELILLGLTFGWPVAIGIYYFASLLADPY